MGNLPNGAPNSDSTDNLQNLLTNMIVAGKFQEDVLTDKKPEESNSVDSESAESTESAGTADNSDTSNDSDTPDKETTDPANNPPLNPNKEAYIKKESMVKMITPLTALFESVLPNGEMKGMFENVMHNCLDSLSNLNVNGDPQVVTQDIVKLCFNTIQNTVQNTGAEQIRKLDSAIQNIVLKDTELDPNNATTDDIANLLNNTQIDLSNTFINLQKNVAGDANSKSNEEMVKQLSMIGAKLTMGLNNANEVSVVDQLYDIMNQASSIGESVSQITPAVLEYFCIHYAPENCPELYTVFLEYEGPIDFASKEFYFWTMQTGVHKYIQNNFDNLVSSMNMYYASEIDIEL
jgi:hypothetical protein